MTMRSVALIVVAALAAAGAGAQDALVVMDANGTVLGPVIGGRLDNTPEDRVTFVYRMGTSWALFDVFYDFVVTTTHQGAEVLYFTTADCTGTAVLSGDEERPVYAQPPSLSLMFVVHPATGEVYHVDARQLSSAVVMSRRIASEYPCPECSCIPMVPPVPVQGWPVELLGTISFTPPLRVALNPVVFNNGFGMGNTSGWTQTVP